MLHTAPEIPIWQESDQLGKDHAASVHPLLCGIKVALEAYGRSNRGKLKLL
jgi:hypothetical protein